jgi:hypothetical protein
MLHGGQLSVESGGLLPENCADTWRILAHRFYRQVLDHTVASGIGFGPGHFEDTVPLYDKPKSSESNH